MHRRPLAPVEQAELDGRGVGKDTHRAAQGIDLANDLPLGHPPDRRIAAHLPDRIAIERQQGRPKTHSRGRQRRLDPGMPGAYHDDVKLIRVVHPRHGVSGSRPNRG